MKKILFTFYFSLITLITFSQQWNGNDNTNDFIWRDGNVGIGTNNPVGDGLTVYGGDEGKNILTLNRSGVGKFEFNAASQNPKIVFNSINTNRFSLGYNSSQSGFIISTDINLTSDNPEFYIGADGNIGMGTRLPVGDGLTVYGGDEGKNILTLNRSGVGKFEFNAASQNPKIVFNSINTNRFSLGYNSSQSGFIISTDINLTSDNPELFIGSNGKIGIGTKSPDYTLDVLGTIRAKEIKVDLNGADFVFEDDYNLKTLEEVESFVKENKHLPEIESANEMETNGAELGELNSKLLQKIEELTLYMIEMNTRMKTVEKENSELKEKVTKLESVQ